MRQIIAWGTSVVFRLAPAPLGRQGLRVHVRDVSSPSSSASARAPGSALWATQGVSQYYTRRVQHAAKQNQAWARPHGARRLVWTTAAADVSTTVFEPQSRGRATRYLGTRSGISTTSVPDRQPALGGLFDSSKIDGLRGRGRSNATRRLHPSSSRGSGLPDLTLPPWIFVRRREPAELRNRSPYPMRSFARHRHRLALPSRPVGSVLVAGLWVAEGRIAPRRVAGPAGQWQCRW